MGMSLLSDAAQWAPLMCSVELSQPACALAAKVKLHFNSVILLKIYFYFVDTNSCLHLCLCDGVQSSATGVTDSSGLSCHMGAGN